MQCLQKRRVDDDRTPGLQDAMDFLSGALRNSQVLENVESEHAIESVVTKGEMMGVAHDVGMPENFVFELDAIRVSRGRASGADVQNKILPCF